MAARMKTEKMKVPDLLLDPANVRTHNEKNLSAIKASLTRFGQQKPIVVDSSGIVVAGNGTLVAADSLGWPTIEVVRTSLKGSEATAYAIADNRTAELAEWDNEALTAQLSALHIEDESLLEVAGFSSEELEGLVDLPDDIEEVYSRKIEAPIYEPSGDKPTVETLFDDEKSRKLAEEIAEADIPEEIAQFLSKAAERHTVFNFGKIADYYAHAPLDIQGLMERSALVIIDFNQAIENGFVMAGQEILGLVGKDYPDA